jgi:hypothetical protein
LVYGGSVNQGSGLVIATIDGSRPPRVAVSGAFLSAGHFLPKRPSLLVSHSTDRKAIRVAREDLGKDFDCDVAVERGIRRPVYLAHAPTPMSDWST